jgi:predicted nucleic acid-binding protein
MGAGGEMYLDSAIIVKLLAREHDSEMFDAALSGHSLDSSELCLTEVCSALLSKERAGGISARERQMAMQRFEEMVQDEELRLFPLDTRVLRRAAAILQACHPKVALRSLDALHVATCDLHECDVLCTTDLRMRSAAAQLGLKLFPGQP